MEGKEGMETVTDMPGEESVTGVMVGEGAVEVRGAVEVARVEVREVEGVLEEGVWWFIVFVVVFGVGWGVGGDIKSPTGRGQPRWARPNFLRYGPRKWV